MSHKQPMKRPDANLKPCIPIAPPPIKNIAEMQVAVEKLTKENRQLRSRIAELESQLRTYEAEEYDRQRDNKFENF